MINAAATLFGLELPIDAALLQNIMLYVMIGMGVLVLVLIIVFIVKHRKQKKADETEALKKELEEIRHQQQPAYPPQPIYIPMPTPSAAAPAAATSSERRMIGIRLETSHVKKQFTVGEEFTHEGLAVEAMYDKPPFEEWVSAFHVFTPDLGVEGRTMVQVIYGDSSAVYPIDVVPAPEENPLEEPAPAPEENPAEEPVPVPVESPAEEPVPAPVESPAEEPVPAPVENPAEEPIPAPEESPAEEPAPIDLPGVVVPKKEESFEAGTLRYEKSFTARLIQSDDQTKQWYVLLKNNLLSYQKVKDRMSWKRETYRRTRDTVARFAFRGKTLCLFLALDPEQVDARYKVENGADNVSYADTPCMYRIKSDLRVKYAKELIAEVMAGLGIPQTDRPSQDYYLPYEGIVELINKGLVKRIVKSKEEEAIFYQGDANAEAEEEIAPAEFSTEEVSESAEEIAE